MPLQKRTMRGVLLLMAATLFFFGLYTLAGFPATDTRIDYKLTEPNSTIDLDKIITAALLDRKYDCHRYYRTYYDSSEAPPSDQLMLYQPPCPLGRDQSDFRFLINQDVCGGETASGDVYMLVLVGSHPSHRQLRDLIRTTWGNPNITGFPFRLAFLFGQMPSAELQSAIDLESRTHRDLIQGSFADSYRNVMLRDLMGLRWAWQYCNRARFVMRADDDISLDVYSLIDVLQQRFDDGAGAPVDGANVTTHKPPLTDFVACFQMMVDTPVLRSGRYAVNMLEHPGAIYAPYCQGWMYILTPQMAFKLDVAAMHVQSYWLNDAFITGSLLEALGKVPVRLDVNYTIEVRDMQASQSRAATLKPVYTVGPTGADIRLTQVLHEKYRRYAQLNGLPRTKWTSRTVVTAKGAATEGQSPRAMTESGRTVRINPSGGRTVDSGHVGAG